MKNKAVIPKLKKKHFLISAFIFKPHDVGKSFTVLISVVLLCSHVPLTEIIVGV